MTILRSREEIFETVSMASLPCWSNVVLCSTISSGIFPGNTFSSWCLRTGLAANQRSCVAEEPLRRNRGRTEATERAILEWHPNKWMGILWKTLRFLRHPVILMWKMLWWVCFWGVRTFSSYCLLWGVVGCCWWYLGLSIIKLSNQDIYYIVLVTLGIRCTKMGCDTRRFLSFLGDHGFPNSTEIQGFCIPRYAANATGD